MNFQEEFKTIFRILGCDVVETQRNIVKGLEGEAYVRGIIKEGFQTDRIKH